MLFLTSEPGTPASADLSANGYSMTGPAEVLQLCLSLAPDNFFFSIFENNSAGTRYAVFSTPGEAQDLSKTGGAVHLHRHEYYEFLFVLEGEIYQNIEHYRHYYPAGGCCLVPPYVLHTEEYSTECRVLFFKLTPEFLGRILDFPRYFPTEDGAVRRRILNYLSSDPRFIDFIPVNGYAWVRRHIHTLFEEMVRELASPSGNASLKMACLADHLLSELFDPKKFSNTPAVSESQKNQELFCRIRDYMEAAPGKVTRAELAARFHYSGDALYKLIKSFTGLSVSEYASYVCTQKAARLLLADGRNINEIAEAVGFHNFTQFYREFKKYYHKTPREYRLAGQNAAKASGYAPDPVV